MREIIFKGKRVDNGEWIIGDLITTPFIRNTTQQNIIYILDITKADYDCFEDLVEDNGIFEVDPETVCQCTGIEDKNGKRIFEGDIVKHDMSDTIGIVKWYCEDYVGWCVDDICIGEQQFTDEMWNECEVIGNIFDNPELLNGGQ